MHKIYLRLLIYNYDASPRHQEIRHECESVEQAEHLRKRLQTLIGRNVTENRTGRWLDQHHGIYGFIEEIEGIYEETTRRIA